MPKIDFDKAVPSPEDVSEDLRSLEARHARLCAESRAVDEEQVRLMQSIGAARLESDRKTQIDALIKESAYIPPADVRDEIAALAKRRVLIQEALHEMSALIRAKREAASRRIAAEFLPEQKALAKEYYQHVAHAVAVHARFGAMKQRIERAGVSASTLHDFGVELCGMPGKRDDHAGYAFRDAVKRGYIGKGAVPAGYL